MGQGGSSQADPEVAVANPSDNRISNPYMVYSKRYYSNNMKAWKELKEEIENYKSRGDGYYTHVLERYMVTPSWLLPHGKKCTCPMLHQTLAPVI